VARWLANSSPLFLYRPRCCCGGRVCCAARAA